MGFVGFVVVKGYYLSYMDDEFTYLSPYFNRIFCLISISLLQVIGQICVSVKGNAWVLKSGDGNSKLNNLNIPNVSNAQVLLPKLVMLLSMVFVRVTYLSSHYEHPFVPSFFSPLMGLDLMAFFFVNFI